MKRFLTPIAFVSLVASAAPTQWSWGDADSPERAQAIEAREKAAAIYPLSPNVILGRARYGDAKAHVAVLLLDRTPAGKDILLVARDADCTPRAVLKPLSSDNRTRTVVCRVTHGAVRPDMEIVLPGQVLLKRASEKLPANAIPPETPAKPAADPEAKAATAPKPGA